MQHLDPETIDAIRHAVGVELDERNRVDAETHAVDHAWVQVQRRREQVRQKRYGRIIDQVTGWAVIVALTALAAFIGNALRVSVQTWLSGGGGGSH